MPLQWEKVAVPLVGGVDTKTDEKSVLPTRLTKLENGEFTKGGSVRKRPGYTRILPQTTGAVDITGLNGLFTRDDELVVTNTTTLYSYDALSVQYHSVGAYVPMTYTGVEAAFTSSEQTVCDMATVAGVTVYAWQDSRGGVRAAVYNEDTGTAYNADLSIQSANAVRPRVVVADNSILIFYFDSSTNDIKAKVIQPASITTSLAAAVVTVITDVNSNGQYDVVSGDGEVLIAYASDGTVVTGNRIAKVSSGGVPSGHTTVNADVAALLGVTYDATNAKAFVVTYHSTTTVAVFRHTYSTLVQEATATAAEAGVTQVTCAPNSAGGITTVWEQSAASASNYTVDVQDFFAGPLALTTYQHSGLASKAFTVGTQVFVLLGYDSRTGVQNNVYLFRADGVWAGRIFTGEGVGILGTGHLPAVSLLAGATFQTALNYKRRLTVKDSGAVPAFAQYEHKGIKRVVFDSGATPRGAEAGHTLYLSGSQLWAYDGSAPVESGFHLFPEVMTSDITMTATPTVAGAIPGSGTFNYRVYYEYTLVSGERFRSAAITRVSPTLNANKVQLIIPTLSHTQMRGVRGEVSIVVYRSEQNAAQLYYRVSSPSPTVTGVNGYIANVPTSTSVTFVDDMADATLITKELDYQSQGLLPNLAPEGPEYLATAQGRLFLVGGGQRPNNARFSKLRFDGEPFEFSDGLLVEDAPEAGGKTTAVAALESAVVVFKERAIYALDGGGPDNTGLQGAYIIREVSSDVGCTEPGAVISYSDGICFKSAEGFYLVDRSFQLNYIGAEVEAYNSQTCTAATAIPDTNQIIFLMSTGVTLMYDTFYRQWSTFTNHAGTGAAVWMDTDYVYLKNTGDVYLRTADVYSDAGISYPLIIRTAPMRIEEGLQYFWRARKLSILGEYRSSHRLKVSVLYNRDEAPFYSFEIEPDDILESSTWGSEATWGAIGTTWGGVLGGREYQFQHRFKRQKCQTLRLEFEDLSTGSPLGASYEITELALEVGTRDGLGRIPATRKI